MQGLRFQKKNIGKPKISLISSSPDCTALFWKHLKIASKQRKPNLIK